MRTLALTVAEVADVITDLEHPCTARRVRYALTAGQGDRRVRGATRLYSPYDVALMRLAVRLEEKKGVSAWVARVVLAYLREELVAALRSRRPKALHLVGVRGAIVSASAPAGAGTVVVPLADLMTGVVDRMRQTRRERPTIWMWRDVGPTVAAAQQVMA